MYTLEDLRRKLGSLTTRPGEMNRPGAVIRKLRRVDKFDRPVQSSREMQRRIRQQARRA